MKKDGKAISEELFPYENKLTKVAYKTMAI